MKSSTDNSSALFCNKSVVSNSFSKEKDFKAFLKVLRLWLNPAFTTCLNTCSSQPNVVLLFLINFITPDFTFGGAVKTFSLTEGKIVGEFKKKIEEAILDGDVENTYDAAYQYMLDIKDEILTTA